MAIQKMKKEIDILEIIKKLRMIDQKKDDRQLGLDKRGYECLRMDNMERKRKYLT